LRGKIPARGRENSGKANGRLLYLFPHGQNTGLFAEKAVKKSGKEIKVKKLPVANEFLDFPGSIVYATLSRFA